MDALSAVLAPVRLQRTAWTSTVGRAPWGLAVPASKSCVRFHFLLRGSAWLTVDKTDEPRIALSGGDLAVVPLGHAHALRDHPRSTTARFDELARCAARRSSTVMHVEIGAKGPETTFITGAFVRDVGIAPEGPSGSARRWLHLQRSSPPTSPSPLGSPPESPAGSAQRSHVARIPEPTVARVRARRGRRLAHVARRSVRRGPRSGASPLARVSSRGARSRFGLFLSDHPAPSRGTG